MRKIIPSLPVLMTTTLNGIMCWGINQLPDKEDLGVPSEIIIGLTLCSVLGIVLFSSQPSESQKGAETTSVTSMWMLGLLPAMGSIILFILIKDGHVPSEFNKAAGYTSLFLFITGTLLPAIIAFWKVQEPIIVASVLGSSDEEKRRIFDAARKNVLKVMSTEVQARLSQSIHRAAFVNLGKEQQPQQVQRPWDMSVKVGEQRSVQLPPQTTILDVFDNPTISGKFLILGKPGGGKTSTLLELAEALIERAEGDSDAPIPVILELSSWQEVTKRKFLPFGEVEKYDPSIKEWVLSQLISKGVSQEMGEQWLREKELVLLLDGLDELPPERQGKCVRAINQFLSSEFSPLHLVVCSRKEEYEDYEEMLQLNGAICLEDLTNEQIRHYFASVNLGEFWESIKGSEKIVNFIRQPLFLAVTSLVYEQIDVEEWKHCNSEQKVVKNLINDYYIKMLKQNSIKNIKNHKQYLTRLSKSLQDNQKEVTVKKIDLILLDSLLAVRIINQISLFLTFFILPILLYFIFNGTFLGILVTAISYAIIAFSVFKNKGFLAAIIPLPIITLASAYYLNTQNLPEDMMVFIPLYYTFVGMQMLYSDFNEKDTEIPEILSETKKYCYEIIKDGFLEPTFAFLKKRRNIAIVLILVTNIIISLAWYNNGFDIPNFLYVQYTYDNPDWRILLFLDLTRTVIAFVILIFFVVGLMTALTLSFFLIASLAMLCLLFTIALLMDFCHIIRRSILRLYLGLTGQMPWNITRFLDYCTERLILQRVGNRYRFIHRLVQEHFANLEIPKE